MTIKNTETPSPPDATSSITTCCTDDNYPGLNHQDAHSGGLMMSPVSRMTPLSATALKAGMTIRSTKIQDSPKTAPPKDNCCAGGECSAGQATTSIAMTRGKGVVADYEVAGMDCPACAITIEKSLKQLTGVDNAQVNFGLGRMHVFIENADLKPQIEQNVRKLGFRLSEINKPTDADEFDIQGMDCGACALTIEKHLKKHPQVQEVSVSFASGKMHIRHHLSPDDIIKEVEKTGYQAEHVTSGTPLDEVSARLFFGMGNVIASGVALATGYALSQLAVPPFFSTGFLILSILVGGRKPFRSAWYAILSKSLDMNVLMSAAAIGAALIGQWVEGAGVVFLFSLGTALQTRCLEKTRSSIRSLMALVPEEAMVKTDGQWIPMPVSSVQTGQVLLIRPADRVPLDGIVISGASGVNQAPITGESMPVDKEAGDPVFAGSINHNGVLEISVTRTFRNTALARIIHMVEEAQSKKSPTQTLVERFSVIYTPIVFVVALLTMVVPPLAGMGLWAEWFYRGLELLVVACPCALVISTPVAIVSAIGNAARSGILIKGGATLEKLATIQVLAFDKTGTLTEGKPRVIALSVLSGSEKQLLDIALTIESHSTHPLAKAVSDYAQKQGAALLPAMGYETIPGKGAIAVVKSEKWFVGSEKLFSNLQPGVKTIIDEYKNQGCSLVIIGTAVHAIGVIAIADTLRDSSVHAIAELRKVGVTHTLMLTGDNQGTAQAIAKKIGIDAFRAELLPEDKVSTIRHYQQAGQVVAMVGDGINDAPALAAADLGIAMGGAGADSAIETADVVLMADKLEQLPQAFLLSRKTSRIIKQNIAFSLLVKLVALAFIFPGWLTLWIAVLSDTGAALVVILNSMRLFRSRRYR